MNALTKKVRTLEQDMVKLIEGSGLPSVIIDLTLTNLLNQVKAIEEREVDPDGNESVRKDGVGE